MIVDGAILYAWIHLSDLHFGEPGSTQSSDKRLVLSKLELDLREVVDSLAFRPQAVLVTGDIAYSGQMLRTDEYELARAWVVRVADSLGVPLGAFHFVPGNHDVQRRTRGPDEKNINRLVQALRDERESIDDVLADPDQRALLSRRLQPYLEFQRSFRGPDTQPRWGGTYWTHSDSVSPNLSINLVGLNSSLLCLDETDHGKLLVGRQQLADVLVEASGGLIICLTHHPFEWLRDESFVSNWIRSNAHIHLCGHVHNSRLDYCRSGSGRGFVTVVSGAAHGDSRIPPHPTSHGYNLAAIVSGPDGGLALRVWPRTWSQKNTRFQVDLENVPSGTVFAQHELAFSVPALSTQLAPLPSRAEVLPSTHQHRVSTPSTRSESAPLGSSPNVRHNLPARGEIIERHNYRQRVLDALASQSTVVCIEGIGGNGKTKLALDVLYGLVFQATTRRTPGRSSPYDVIVWISEGHTGTTLDEILDAIARTIDAAPLSSLTLADKEREVLGRLRAIRGLVVLDNAESIEDGAVFAFIRRFSQLTKCLATTGTLALADEFPEARWIHLLGLEPLEAAALVRLESQRLELDYSEDRIGDLVTLMATATGGSPLAMWWAIGQVKEAGQSLESVVEALVRGDGGDLFQRIFARSWQLLTPKSRTLLVTASLFAAPVRREVLQAATGMAERAFDIALTQLVAMLLVEADNSVTTVNPTFALHPLTRAFAKSQLRHRFTLERNSFRRLSDFYVRILEPYGDSQESDKYLAFVKGEVRNIITAAEWNVEHGYPVAYVRSVRVLSYYFDHEGLAMRAVEMGVRAVAAAIEALDRAEEARAHGHAVAWFLFNLGRFGDAEKAALRSLRLYRQLGDFFSYATMLSLLGEIHRQCAKNDIAIRVFERAISILREHSTTASELAYIEGVTGHLHITRCDRDAAAISYRRAHELYESVGSPRAAMEWAGRLADLELERGQYQSAYELSLSVLARGCKLHRLSAIGHALAILSLVYRECGRPDTASTVARDAYSLLAWIGSRRTEILVEAFAGGLESRPSSVEDVDRIVSLRCSNQWRASLPEPNPK